MENIGVVYILEAADNTIKTGKTTNITNRIKQIKFISGKEIVREYFSRPTKAYSELECEMHYRFKKHCIGNEWYRVNFNVVSYQLYQLENSIINDPELKRAKGILLASFSKDCLEIGSHDLCHSQFCPNYNDGCVTEEDFDLLFEKHGENFNYSDHDLMINELNKIKGDFILRLSS